MVIAAVPDELRGLLPEVDGVEVRFYDPADTATVPGDGGGVDVISLPLVAGPWLKRLDEVPGLHSVVLSTAGYEHALPHLPDGVSLANAVGVHDTATAELALALMGASQRHLPTHVLAQHAQTWGPPTPPGQPSRSLADSTVLVLGYGGVGRALTRRLLASECEVVAVASTDKPGDDLVDRVYGTHRLPELLPRADILAITLPLTEQTAGLVGEVTLAALPDDALVVNVGRGGIVDTEALRAECASGRLRAALDVTDPEPLPDGHPLWSTPGVLIVPHVGGASPASLTRMASYLHRQLTAYRDTGSLEHLVVG